MARACRAVAREASEGRAKCSAAVVKFGDRFQELRHCLLTSLLVHTRLRPSARIASCTRLGAAFWDRCFGPTILTQDRLVAVKAFKLDVPPQTVVRLADALRRLVERPAIAGAPIRVLDAGLEGTRAFLAMEYAAGESIDVAWRQQLPVPIERALPILSLVADALDASWAQGIGHGALHPRDIFFMVSGTDEIRLTGLGIVQAIESIGEKAPVRRPYAAPERVALQPWGLGGRRLFARRHRARAPGGPPAVRRGAGRHSRAGPLAGGASARSAGARRARSPIGQRIDSPRPRRSWRRWAPPRAASSWTCRCLAWRSVRRRSRSRRLMPTYRRTSPSSRLNRRLTPTAQRRRVLEPPRVGSGGRRGRRGTSP